MNDEMLFLLNCSEWLGYYDTASVSNVTGILTQSLPIDRVSDDGPGVYEVSVEEHTSMLSV